MSNYLYYFFSPSHFAYLSVRFLFVSLNDLSFNVFYWQSKALRLIPCIHIFHKHILRLRVVLVNDAIKQITFSLQFTSLKVAEIIINIFTNSLLSNKSIEWLNLLITHSNNPEDSKKFRERHNILRGSLIALYNHIRLSLWRDNLSSLLRFLYNNITRVKLSQSFFRANNLFSIHHSWRILYNGLSLSTFYFNFWRNNGRRVNVRLTRWSTWVNSNTWISSLSQSFIDADILVRCNLHLTHVRLINKVLCILQTLLISISFLSSLYIIHTHWHIKLQLSHRIQLLRLQRVVNILFLYHSNIVCRVL